MPENIEENVNFDGKSFKTPLGKIKNIIKRMCIFQM